MSYSRDGNLETAFLMPTLQLFSSITLGKMKKILHHYLPVKLLFIRFNPWSEMQRPGDPVKEIMHRKTWPSVCFKPRAVTIKTGLLISTPY